MFEPKQLPYGQWRVEHTEDGRTLMDNSRNTPKAYRTHRSALVACGVLNGLEARSLVLR